MMMLLALHILQLLDVILPLGGLTESLLSMLWLAKQFCELPPMLMSYVYSVILEHILCNSLVGVCLEKDHRI